MTISKDQISMQLQKGTVWLALTDITMRTVIVLAWEKPLITKKDKLVWTENQKLNESPSSVIFGGLMICRFWRKWPNLCLLKQGGMQDGRRTGGKCVQGDGSTDCRKLTSYGFALVLQWRGSTSGRTAALFPVCSWDVITSWWKDHVSGDDNVHHLILSLTFDHEAMLMQMRRHIRGRGWKHRKSRQEFQ